MYPRQKLKEFVSQRLTAAAEEIFGVMDNIIVEYEEELGRQRKLLDVLLKPEIKLHRIDLQQQHVCKQEDEEEEDPSKQQLCHRKSVSNVEEEEPELPWIKEKREDLCSGPLVVKQEIHTSILTPSFGERVHCEPEADDNHRLLSHSSPVTEIQEQKGGKHAAPESTSHGSSESTSHLSAINSDTQPNKKSCNCDTCGKAFKTKYKLKIHLRSHTGEKPYVCGTCGKRFTQMSTLKTHTRIHTGETPYTCKTCGKGFRYSSGLLLHMRIHTGEKPYVCTTCGKCFRASGGLLVHTWTHTGEKPYHCDACGKRFTQKSSLNVHVKIHASEKLNSYSNCGKSLSESGLEKTDKNSHKFQRGGQLTEHGLQEKTLVRNLRLNT